MICIRTVNDYLENIPAAELAKATGMATAMATAMAMAMTMATATATATATGMAMTTVTATAMALAMCDGYSKSDGDCVVKATKVR